MRSFQHIYADAVTQHGSDAEVQHRLRQYWPQPLSTQALSKIDGQIALSAIAKTIFQAGFSWRVVELKWPDILAAMDDLDPYMVAMWPDERLEALVSDTRVIRHYAKLNAIRDNAQWLLELIDDYGSIGHWLAPYQDVNESKGQVVELFWQLKKSGAWLGGRSGSLALRRMGLDTFVLTPDVIRALQREEILDPASRTTENSKRGQQAAQDAFNIWHAESGKSFQDISRILALTIAART